MGYSKKRKASKGRYEKTGRKKTISKGLPPSKASMEKLLKEGGLKVTPAKLTKLWRFHQLLRKYDKELDLTRLKNFQTMVIKHYLDSLYIRKLVKLQGPLVDIGTGAGFPGIPLMIFTPSLEIILAEKRKKRVQFLEIACKELELGGQIYPHSVHKDFPIPVQGVITRAVESMEETLEKAEAFLPVGGRVYFMKGPHYHKELERCKSLFQNQFEICCLEEYTLPHTDHRRSLIVFQKKKDKTL
ncbi:MAG: 16S rRNA (guanine(527)-N(7))-methyltransferase RsmG [Planctomycetota bacterium]|nr:MAG: 16S rRNA (guanine(527)-N(7))-methyltransferase RsmG [Planctomycetota bacterium]